MRYQYSYTNIYRFIIFMYSMLCGVDFVWIWINQSTNQSINQSLTNQRSNHYDKFKVILIELIIQNVLTWLA